MTIASDLNADEGVKLKPYLDCCGKDWRDCACQKKGNMTIGVGTNLDWGISEEEAFMLRDNRINSAMSECAKYPWFQSLDDVRKEVIAEMMFNLGASKFAQFQRLVAALERKDYVSAASEMKSSHWAAEVGKRAVRLANMMESGNEAR